MRGSPEKYTAEQFIKAIPGSGGIVTTIAKRVGCTWHTAKKYIDNYATVGKAYEAELEAVLDMAESVLFQNIREGDTGDAKWLLSRKGRARGYYQKQEVETTGDIKISLKWDEDNGD